jgi:NitT/TauT family transport system substrate-binding protein
MRFANVNANTEPDSIARSISVSKGRTSMNFNRTSIQTICIGLIVALILSACGSSAPVAQRELSPIRIGTNQWVGWGALYIAQAKGFFAKEGVKVELVPFDSNNAGNAAFATKQLDATTTILSDSVAQAAAKIQVQVVWIFDESQGGDVLVGNSAIHSPSELKGKRIGLSYGTFGHIFVLAGLAKYGINRDDITIVNISGEDVPQALAEGKIDAGHTWDPYLNDALKNGSHAIFTSADTPGIINDVLEFQTNTLQNRPDDVKAIFRAMQDASAYWAANPFEANEIVAKAVNAAPSDIPALRQTVHIFSLAEVQTALDPTASKSLYKTVQTISNFFVNEKVINHAPDAQTLLNATFAQTLSEKKQ